jgi:hypothetical protein
MGEEGEGGQTTELPEKEKSKVFGQENRSNDRSEAVDMSPAQMAHVLTIIPNFQKRRPSSQCPLDTMRPRTT